MPGWDDALDLQNDLRRSLRSLEGQRYLSWYATGASKAIRYEGDKIIEGELVPGSFRKAIGRSVSVIEKGEPMWVSEEVAEMVAWAAESFEPEAVYPHDLLIPCAFCLLPSPWASVDGGGRLILFRAISWGEIQFDLKNPGDVGLNIALWSHATDEDAYTQAPAGFPRRVAGCPLVLKHTAEFHYADPDAMRLPANHILFKNLQVLWRLAWQTIVTAQRQSVSRATWRRKSNWREIKTVTTLTLRRAKRPARREGESVVEWTHRWPVKPHWRNQWYPSLKDHRQIWIDGYVKGPDNLPFVAKSRGIDFIR